MIKYNPLYKNDGTLNQGLSIAPSESIVFDVPGKCIWVKGVKLKGINNTYTFSNDNYITLTNTPDPNDSEIEDIKIGVNITTLKAAIDTTYDIVSSTVNGLAPKFSAGNLADSSASTSYSFLGLQGSTLKWYTLPHRNVYVNTTEVQSVSNTDPLKFVAGNGITITWDSTNKCIEIVNSKPDINHNTDFQVGQYVTSTNSDYRILLKKTANDTEETATARFATTLTFNPSTNVLKINGNKVITVVDVYTGATSTESGIVGLVPVATSAQRHYFLRGDGTWQDFNAQNTWRIVKVEGTQKLASTTDTDALDFHGDTGIEITYDGTNKRINIKNTAPDQNHNTDRTGVKLGTVSGTKKIDGTVILANSVAGLTLQGSTNKFLIGDGTNYIEVPITINHGLGTKNMSVNGTNYAIYTSASSLPTFFAPGSLGSNGQLLGTDGSTFTWITPSWAASNHTHNYLPIAVVSEEQTTNSNWGKTYAESNSPGFVYNTHGREWAYWIGMPSSRVNYGTILRLSHDGLVQYAHKAGGGAGENWSAWKNIITSDNIGLQSVNYATSAGNADTVDNYHADSFLIKRNIRSDQDDLETLRYNFGSFDKGDYQGTYKDQYPVNYGQYISLQYGTSNCAAHMFFENIAGSTTLGHIYVRTRGAGNVTTWSNWGMLAYTTDNVASATKLETARTFTINGSGKTFDGTSNVSWTLEEIGASAAHNHPYLPLAGGTMLGDIRMEDMNVGIRWQVNYLGGWARDFISFIQHDTSNASDSLTAVFKIGALGYSNGYNYTYMGKDNYDSENNLRFNNNNTITIGSNLIAHAGNIINSAATIGTSLTTIATIAGINITAKIGSYATSDHSHSLSIVADTGTNQLTLSPSSKYKLTAGGNTFIFITPTDENVKQTPKTDNVNRPLMMINGGTSQGEQINTSLFSTGIYANTNSNMITTSGFIKTGSDSSHVLLGDGGHKALSDFSMSEHNHDERYLRILGNLGSLGNGSNGILFNKATEYCTTANLPYGSGLCYGSNGEEYTALFSKHPTNDNYGSILKWGYNDTYIYIARKKAGNWLSSDWERISAGYADSSNYANSAGNSDTVDGYHASSFLIFRELRSNQDDLSTLRWNYGSYDLCDFNGTYANQYPSCYGKYISLQHGTDNTAAQIFIDCPAWSTTLGHVFIRTRGAGTVTDYSSWGALAYLTDNVASATKLQTARNINGTAFDGTANITTSYWGTARTITIGNTGKSVNGSADVSWSLSEIGAAPEHSHPYLPIAYVSENQTDDWGKDYAKTHYNSYVYNSYGREWAYWIGMRPDLAYGTILRISYDGLVQYCGKTGGDKDSNWSAWKNIITSDNIGSQSVNYATNAGNADTVDNIHANGLLTEASLGSSGNSTTLSVTVGGTTKTGSVTVPYATNSDTVDGYHASSFLQRRDIRSDQNDPDDLRYNFGSFDKCDYNGTYADEYPTCYGQYISLAYGDNNTAVQLFFDCPCCGKQSGPKPIYVRTRGAGATYEYSPWGALAYLTDNVASATKLQTARLFTIGNTGKSFDGTANVSWTLAEIGVQPDKYLWSEQVSQPQDSTYGTGPIDWAVSYAASHPRSFVYNTYGAEYSYLNGMNGTSYGTILKMGYTDRYLRILRKAGGNWQSTDWEKIYAGYADNAGDASTLGGTAKNGLLTAFSLGTNGDDTTSSITVGGTTLSSSVTVPYSSYTGRFKSHGCSNWDANNLTYPIAENYGQSGGSSNYPGGYGSVFQILASGGSSLGGQFFWSINHNNTSSTGNLYFRAGNNLGWQNDWKRVAWASEIPDVSNRVPFSSTSVQQTNAWIRGQAINGTYTQVIYNSYGQEWAYWICMNPSKAYGTILRISYDGWIQYCGKLGGAADTSTNWSDWYDVICSRGGQTINGNLTATNFYTTSDQNKKTNISSFSEHIRKFQLKDTEKWHYGVIAQEVPEMFRDGEEGNMTVNYNSILSFYIGQLENKVKMLEERIKRLESK